MNDAKHVTINRFRYGHMAQCEQCNQLHPDSTRERCRLHVQQTGHKVRFLIEDVTTYEPGRLSADRSTT